tara:strand:- start:142 stop:690 length:549 start_codon:yes stop_codon:yes gene_type:complete
MDLEKEAIIEKNILFEKVKTAILSTVDEKGNPNASYCPIGIDNNNNIYIYISELSKHTSNLLSNKKISVMLIEDESNSTNIFARKRLTIDVEVIKIDRGTVDWFDKITYLDTRYGESMKYLKDMIDFHLFQLIPKQALLVYGFGKAFKLYGPQLESFKHLNEKGHKKSLKKLSNEELNKISN